MLTLELSSYVLEIPNDVYQTLSQNLICCSTLSQECSKLIGLYLEGNFDHKHALLVVGQYS